MRSESLSRTLGVVLECYPVQWNTEEDRSKTLERASGIQQRGPPVWEEPPEQSPHRALAEEVGVILIVRIVAPEVSPQAVDQLPITSTKSRRTEGPVFTDDLATCDSVVIGLSPDATAFLLQFPITAVMDPTAPISPILGGPFATPATVAAIEAVVHYWILPSHFLDHGTQF